jgi:hypothetical protein
LCDHRPRSNLPPTDLRDETLEAIIVISGYSFRTAPKTNEWNFDRVNVNNGANRLNPINQSIGIIVTTGIVHSMDEHLSGAEKVFVRFKIHRSNNENHAAFGFRASRCTPRGSSAGHRSIVTDRWSLAAGH